MPRANPLWLCAISLVLSACSSSGEEAARDWIKRRAPMALPDASSTVPPIVDTPPATFAAGTVQDPFAPGRINQSSAADSSGQANVSGRWRFADTPLDAVRVVGFLEVSGQYVAALEGNAGFVNVKVGDRIGNQQLEVVEISSKGVRLKQSDGSDIWMPITRRGR